MKEESNCALNRLDYLILATLHDGECYDHYHSMTITEIMDANDKDGLGIRNTVYRRLKRLAKRGHVVKGCIDNHADTFYLSDKGIAEIKGGKTE